VVPTHRNEYYTQSHLFDTLLKIQTVQCATAERYARRWNVCVSTADHTHLYCSARNAAPKPCDLVAISASQSSRKNTCKIWPLIEANSSAFLRFLNGQCSWPSPINNQTLPGMPHHCLPSQTIRTTQFHHNHISYHLLMMPPIALVASFNTYPR